ncbi:hypothetical protein LNO36_00250 [Klebsiella variicola subsp. variicola]|nr:hypothetical protein [Klebsiella variicola subsp. variicola]
MLGGVLSGLSGALYTLWGSYITPSSMGLSAAAMPVIWVATAGRKNIFGTVIITAILVWLSQWLAVYGSEYALILLGAILLLVVLAAPNGLYPGWLRASPACSPHAGKRRARYESGLAGTDPQNTGIKQTLRWCSSYQSS